MREGFSFYDKYREIINKLGNDINKSIDNKLDKIILKDCDNLDYTLSLYLIIDCNKDDLMDNYYILVDDVVATELSEHIIISIYPYTIETFKAINPTYNVTDIDNKLIVLYTRK